MKNDREKIGWAVIVGVFAVYFIVWGIVYIIAH